MITRNDCFIKVPAQHLNSADFSSFCPEGKFEPEEITQESSFGFFLYEYGNRQVTRDCPELTAMDLIRFAVRVIGCPLVHKLAPHLALPIHLMKGRIDSSGVSTERMRGEVELLRGVYGRALAKEERMTLLSGKSITIGGITLCQEKGKFKFLERSFSLPLMAEFAAHVLRDILTYHVVSKYYVDFLFCRPVEDFEDGYLRPGFSALKPLETPDLWVPSLPDISPTDKTPSTEEALRAVLEALSAKCQEISELASLESLFEPALSTLPVASSTVIFDSAPSENRNSWCYGMLNEASRLFAEMNQSGIAIDADLELIGQLIDVARSDFEQAKVLPQTIQMTMPIATPNVAKKSPREKKVARELTSGDSTKLIALIDQQLIGLKKQVARLERMRAIAARQSGH